MLDKSNFTINLLKNQAKKIVTLSEPSLCKGLNGNPNARLEQEGQFFIWGGFYTVECSEHERIIELCDFPEIIK